MKSISMKAARVANDLTQGQLAEKLGVSTQTIKNYELKKHKVPYEMAIKIAETLGFELDDINFF